MHLNRLMSLSSLLSYFFLSIPFTFFLHSFHVLLFAMVATIQGDDRDYISRNVKTCSRIIRINSSNHFTRSQHPWREQSS